MTATATAPSLSTIERVIYDRLVKRPGKDIEITLLYRAAFGVSEADLPSKKTRDLQQKLGPYIARLNKKLEPQERVVPGIARRTYRLETASAAG